MKINNIHFGHSDNFALSAVDLNADGSILTFSSAMKGPDAVEWRLAYGEEVIRTVEQGKGIFIRRSAVPKGKTVSYCNPQARIKLKNGKLVKRMRNIIGGN